MKFERFIKKPVIVDVIQYQGVVIECLKNDMRIKWNGDELPDDCISIMTVDGNTVCYKGDYIIRGDQGEIYSCDAKKFESTYERAPLRKKRVQKIEAEVNDVFEGEEDSE